MHTKRFHPCWLGILLFFALAGCGTPAPATNSPAIETSLASTARAFARQSETANPRTPTPVLTATITSTPAPKVSLSGTSLIFQDDGTALFVDHPAGIQLTVPAGWLPFRLNEKEYYDAFTTDVVLANPALSDRLTWVQDLDINVFRLEAFDIREGHIVNGTITDLNVIFEQGDTRSLEKWAQAETNRKSPFKNHKLLSVGYPKTEDGRRVLVIERSWAKDPSSRVYQRSVFFSLPTGTLVLDFYTSESFKDAALPDFEQIVNSLKPLTP